MNNPELYHSKEFLKAEMQNFFSDHKTKIRLRTDGKDSLLDIGCAGGNITVDVIRPILLPETFSRLVGVDINRNMVSYASEHFQHPNVSFDVLDVGGDITEFLSAHQRFDHITSTLALHLVPDQQLALKNIFNLLQPNGDCLLYIIADYIAFDIYGKMYKKWSKYMHGADDFISPYYGRVDPKFLLQKYLKNAGFARCEVGMKTEPVLFDDINSLKESLRSFLPYMQRMSATEQEDFLDEFVELVLSDGKAMGKSFNGIGNKINVPFTIITAFAEK